MNRQDIPSDRPADGVSHLLGHVAGEMVSGTLQSVSDGGLLRVSTRSHQVLDCSWLDTGALRPTLDVGDTIAVLMLHDGSGPLAIGRIGRYARPEPTLNLEATESLTLRCGESSVTLRADGKVMVKGEDVLLRATGTQRIRAGNVAIN